MEFIESISIDYVTLAVDGKHSPVDEVVSSFKQKSKN